MLYEMPEQERNCVAAWFEEESIDGCRGQIEEQLGIKASPAAVHQALAYSRKPGLLLAIPGSAEVFFLPRQEFGAPRWGLACWTTVPGSGRHPPAPAVPKRRSTAAVQNAVATNARP